MWPDVAISSTVLPFYFGPINMVYLTYSMLRYTSAKSGCTAGDSHGPLGLGMT